MTTSNKEITMSINTNENIQNQFLEAGVVNEIYQIVEQIENICKSLSGEEIVNKRIQQLAYSKLLCNIYGKSSDHLVKAYTQLGIAYLDIEYYEQAQEHLLSAFRLNEASNDELNLTSKEQQIKILINLSKCYLENGKASSALSICDKCLKMNYTLLGEDHISNADIYYVLAKVN